MARGGHKLHRCVRSKVDVSVWTVSTWRQLQSFDDRKFVHPSDSGSTPSTALAPRFSLHPASRRPPHLPSTASTGPATCTAASGAATATSFATALPVRRLWCSPRADVEVIPGWMCSGQTLTWHADRRCDKTENRWRRSPWRASKRAAIHSTSCRRPPRWLATTMTPSRADTPRPSGDTRWPAVLRGRRPPLPLFGDP